VHVKRRSRLSTRSARKASGAAKDTLYRARSVVAIKVVGIDFIVLDASEMKEENVPLGKVVVIRRCCSKDD